MNTIVPLGAQLSSMSREELLHVIEDMRAAPPTSRITFKVSEKGCVSVYGLNVRGIHLYASQWLRVLEIAPQLKQFIADNKTKLAWKAKD